MEIPMNLLMKRLGANVTLPIMVILWGVVCACQGTGRTFLPCIAVLSTFYSF
jgi:sugar phosphate permease